MLLVGRDLSPFVRRCAVSLTTLGFNVERKQIATTEQETLRQYSPIGRVPVLLLDDGEALIDSTAILDYLDQIVGPERALLPATGTARRQVLQVIAYAMGAAEKAVAGNYERNLRPADKVHKPWLERLDTQTAAALAGVEERLPDSGWLFDNRLGQGEISAVCAYRFVEFMAPHLTEAQALPKLTALAAHCDSLPGFAETELSKYRA